MGEHRKHHCHEQIAAAFGKLINPRCSRSTQCVELLWGFVGIQCIYRVTSHNYVLNAAPYASLSLWQPFWRLVKTERAIENQLPTIQLAKSSTHQLKADRIIFYI